jgi:hypothetical protein
MKYYFLRVNGASLHTDPNKTNCFVAIEPTEFKRSGYSNYLKYCFENNIVRMGWPDVGDLIAGNRSGARANCYNLSTLPTHIQPYLLSFKDIQPRCVLLVPDRDHSGHIYVCEVVKPYWYDPSDPYECAHRLGVVWDRDNQNNPILYNNDQFGISIGGWWLRAFHEIDHHNIISIIEVARKK